MIKGITTELFFAEKKEVPRWKTVELPEMESLRTAVDAIRSAGCAVNIVFK